ncbi:MAG: hypothetical protein IJ524_05370 [Bacteroidales bacterium]|nr:hypothetical protein [Bacteroidales bacterium]
MKRIINLSLLLAAIMCMAACEKNKDTVRDIVYTVAPVETRPAASAIGDTKTTTVHLETEAEWQALLDRFCDWAEEGSSVTFHNANKSPKSHTTKDATTFSTTSREEMKRWMAEMEDNGKTVTVTYDPATGTWSGTAYAVAPQPHDSDCYTGVLVCVANPPMSAGENLPGLVMALQVNADTTMIISMYDNWFWNDELPLEGVTYHSGDTVTLCGELMHNHDYYGNEFLFLELGGAAQPDPAPSGTVVTYVCDCWPIYIALVTVDPATNQCYGTWAVDRNWSLYGLPWGSCSYTTWGYTCLECPQEYHLTNNYWDGIDVEGTCQLHGDTLHMEYGGMVPASTTCIATFDLVRSSQYETWVSTNNGYDVVLHIDRANRVAVASTPADYINTIVHFPQGRFHYEDDEYGNRQTYRGTYPPVLDTVPLYGEAYNIYQASPTQEEWSLICDCINPPTFIFNRVN